MKKVEEFLKIGQLKHVLRRWRSLTLGCRSGAGADSSPWPGCIPIYVGPDRQLFVISLRLLSFPALSGFFRLKEEEHPLPVRDPGCLALPCDPAFFGFVLDAIDRDEARYGNLTLDAFFALFTDLSPSAAANVSTRRYYAAANGSTRRHYASSNTFSRLLTRTTNACSMPVTASPPQNI